MHFYYQLDIYLKIDNSKLWSNSYSLKCVVFYHIYLIFHCLWYGLYVSYILHILAPVVYTSEAASSVRLWAGEPFHMIRASRTLWGKKVMMLDQSKMQDLKKENINTRVVWVLFWRKGSCCSIEQTRNCTSEQSMAFCASKCISGQMLSFIFCYFFVCLLRWYGSGSNSHSSPL